MNYTKLATIAVTMFVVIGAPVLRAGTLAVPGEQRRWMLDFRVRLEQPAGEHSGAERPVELKVRGAWVSTIAAVHPGEYDVALELAGASLNGAVVGSGLAQPFWATYREDGALLAVHFRKTVTPNDRNLLQMIASEMQVVHAVPDRPAWTVLERDGAGEYLAIYHRTGPASLTKRKIKYVHTDAAASAPANGVRIAVDQSEIHLSLDPEGGVLTLDGTNRTRIGVPFGNAGQLTALTETHLTDLRKTQAPELIGSLARASQDVVTSPVITHNPDAEHLHTADDQRLLEGHTTDSLLRAALLEPTPPNARDHLLAYRLAALFRQRPEAAKAAVALLRPNGRCKRITDALASAGSPAAIDALGDLTRDRTLPRPLRIDALSAFVLVQRPSVEAMRIPPTLADDADARIASAARIVSGALARAGRAAHAAEADAIDAALVAHFRKARENGELSDLLAAMGNSIGASVLPVIKDALHDPRGPVRTAAARALRLAPGPEIDALLAATIANDPDPAVRAAAIFAAGFRHPLEPVLSEALVQTAKADTVEFVRIGAVTLLRQHPDASPRTAETLAWVAAHDATPGVRRLAQEALGSVGKARQP